MIFNITWIGQAGYILSTGGTTLAIDPYCSDSIAGAGFLRLYPSLIPRKGLHVDAVISTHAHGDHLDVETLTEYVDFRSFYGPGSCVNALTKAGFDGQKLNILDRGQTVKIGDFVVTAVFADHTADSIGVVVEYKDVKLYFSGDSRYHKELFETIKLKPDIIFVCINGKYGNMTWQEAADLSKGLGVKCAIPAHYDMFAINSENPSLFTESFSDTSIRSFVLERGKEYEVMDLFTGE